MLVSKTDPNAPKLLQNFLMVAAGCMDRRGIERVAGDVARLQAEGIEFPALRLGYEHPLAHYTRDVFEQRGVAQACVLV